MKRLLCIIAFLPFYCFGQNTGTVINTGATNQATIQKGATGADSAMVLPVIDTTRGKNYLGSGSVSLRKKGRIIVNSSDSTLYYYDGGKWKVVGGADSTIFATQYQLDTAKDNIRGEFEYGSVIGTIYQAASWANLDTFSSNFTGYSINGDNNIAFTSGSSTSADSVLSLDYFTLLDRWDMTGRFIVNTKNSTSYGFGMGMFGTAGYKNSVYVTFNMTDNATQSGKLYVRTTGSTTLRDSSTTGLSFVAGDTLTLRVYFNYDNVKVTGIITNLRTANSVTVDYSAREAEVIGQNNSALAYSTGKYSIFSRSGGFTLDSLYISSNTIKNADMAIIGDSKAWGALVTDIRNCWPKVIMRYYPNTVVLAGSGDWIEDALTRANQLRDLVQPKQVLLSIGYNNFFSGQNTDTINSLYSRLVDTLENAGIRVIKILPQYDNRDQSTLRTFILANYDDADIIDVYPQTAACGNACLDVFQIHPNDSGSAIIAAGILSSGKIKGATDNYHYYLYGEIKDLQEYPISTFNSTLTLNSVAGGTEDSALALNASNQVIKVPMTSTTPTLAQVTTAGATTTNSVTVGVLRASNTDGDYVELSFSGGLPRLVLFNNGIALGNLTMNGSGLFAFDRGASVTGNLTVSGTLTMSGSGFLSGGGSAPQLGALSLWAGAGTSPFIELSRAGVARDWHIGSVSGNLVFNSAPSTSANISGTTMMTLNKTYGFLGIKVSPSQALHVGGQVKVDTIQHRTVTTDSILVRNSGVISSRLPENYYTGWGDYDDTLFTEASPLSLTAGTKITLPNRAHVRRESQKPIDIDSFYSRTDSTILGRNGDGLNILIEFKIKPTTPTVTKLSVTLDIGGSIGEIYPRDFILTKGSGVEHYYLSSFSAYTLDTWQSNGAKVKVEVDHDAEIYDIRYVLTRTHKAR